MTKIVYLFTTFPKSSETFLQREVEVLAKDKDLSLNLYSFYRGQGESFANIPVRHLGVLDWVISFLRIVEAVFRRPGILFTEIRHVLRSPPRSWTNAGEQILGWVFAFRFWKEFSRNPPHRIHAVWATAPGTAAFLLHRLGGIPFSMEAHAYDLYRCGGDCWFERKVQAANFIRTSTESARKEISRRCPRKKEIHLIRRGLIQFPDFSSRNLWHSPLRLLSVGRLVSKKGFFYLLDIAENLKEAGYEFTLVIIGDGPLRFQLEKRCQERGLEQQVEFTGALPVEEVWGRYAEADIFLFTGRVAKDGDRDGFPNVIGEAMASGVLVLATDVAGTTEGIHDYSTGRVLPPDEPAVWRTAIEELKANPAHIGRMKQEARAWVNEHFDARSNTRLLAKLHKTFFTA